MTIFFHLWAASSREPHDIICSLHDRDSLRWCKTCLVDAVDLPGDIPARWEIPRGFIISRGNFSFSLLIISWESYWGSDIPQSNNTARCPPPRVEYLRTGIVECARSPPFPRGLLRSGDGPSLSNPASANPTRAFHELCPLRILLT